MVYALNVKVGFRPNYDKIQLYSSVEVLNLKKCSRILKTLQFRFDQWPQASQNLSLRLTTESLVISSLILLRPHQFMFRYLVHFRDDFRSISKKITRNRMVKIWRLKTACIDITHKIKLYRQWEVSTTRLVPRFSFFVSTSSFSGFSAFLLFARRFLAGILNP